MNESGIAVWPIGAFEQHSHHMPLNTDNLITKYFAKIIADPFGACFLPVLSFETSLEHPGFRGSITLNPELLIQVINNMANELEKQNFKYCLIINGHGGNHSIAPAVRYINRRDGKIKLLLVEPWDFGELSKETEIHSDKMETS